MRRPSPDGARSTRAVLSLAFVLAACSLAPAQTPQDPDGRLEEIPLVDPYTRGAHEALERAGYVSFGPFPWLLGATTDEIEKALGERRMLWVETAHFKLGSTLATYKTGTDRLEDKQLRAELARLAKKLARVDPEKRELDPWLRLHLFAQRLEEQATEFLQRFGFDEREFASPRGPYDSAIAELGPGPYFGMKWKPTVLLTETDATLGRFLGEFAHAPPETMWRGRLEGGTMFLGQSAEGLRARKYELDVALHCSVAAVLAYNLVEGFRGIHDSSPEWFKCGLASWFSRRIDARWTILARGTTYWLDDDSWKWSRRVRGLVANDAALPWSKMLDWTKWEDIDAQGHMVLWSRFDWLLSRKNADLRAFLMGMTEPTLARPQQDLCLFQAFGAKPAELDAQWKDFVLKNASRK